MEQTGTDARLVVHEISKPLYQSKGWMQLLGVLSIINGAVLVFTLFGILIAWLPIWIGVLLLQSASSAERASSAGDKQALVASLGRLKTYFAIQGVMTLIGIIFVIIVIAFGLMSAIMSSVF